jgi:hypothetical protein
VKYNLIIIISLGQLCKVFYSFRTELGVQLDMDFSKASINYCLFWE